MNSYVKGNYKKSIFMSEDGYRIGIFKVQSSSDDLADFNGKTVTFTGYFHELNESDTYLFYGSMKIHAKYGEQFAVEQYERVKPEEKDGIISFLSSGLFKGIGDAKAKKIVECLGKDTLDIILTHPEQLQLVPSITKKQQEILHNTLREYESSYQVILMLTERGFSTKESMRIYNHYKKETVQVIENNIYQIYDQIKDIPFKKIDQIALSSGYLWDDARRIGASILYGINEVMNIGGNSYFLIEELFGYTNRILGNAISKEDFIEAINTLILEGKVVKQDEKYYLQQMYEAEEYIAKRIKYLMQLPSIKKKNIDKMIEDLELSYDISYNEEQREAIKNAILKNVLVITGGPGTGKTTIIKSVIELYRNINHLNYNALLEKVALLAPTGRASKRLSETAGISATTIHRFLKWNKESDRFLINEYNKSTVEMVVIDEVSMIDTYLMDHLLRGLKTDTKIILVGDYHQLPSVGAGQVLKDIIDSHVVHTTILQQLYRQKEGSNILSFAKDANHGVWNPQIFSLGEDLTFIAADQIVDEVQKLSLEYRGIDYKNFQILAPMYKTRDGIDRMNQMIQEIFNPKDIAKNELIVGDVIYREQDKVLQLSNMPEENIFNGDIGLIRHVSKKEITIDFDGNLVKFTPSNFKNFKHGYAISIHKSQGSEFDYVILPVSYKYSKMLYRKLYYTAITRCKKKLILVGSFNALEQALLNDEAASRRTSLKQMLIKKMQNRE